ncbi:alpha-L-arabinofuranosidase C-terminal domain-containing protein [Mucilaginibacter aquaedulcis]|uniref:alpha-L-arabinofuranosidase C-terminal domain-containing protein n=1 Tax=Mucilaginibacter aquaedulcis TaxID=1187081 RepID=UPI0025B306CA|nr:alpha-L-arabinofuranosidase C-terminal domain-containing protein [Mucilaginibacter aquaedulcis]MDN3551046.1 alpha-L-arabinofuranosidase C-terminal domain-containing protein [Mucilaginibacter aquaedulcis]
MILKNNALFIRLSAFILCAAPISVIAQKAQITVDPAKVLNNIPSAMFGSCTEDVNHEIYGGLYNQRLFGESFEEPAAANALTGWTQLPAEWRISGDGYRSSPGPGFKLIQNKTIIKDGSIEATITFASRARNAGLLVRANNVIPGNPTPKGYAIEVSKGRGRIVIKKYLNGWQEVARSAGELDINDSVRLRVDLKGEQIKLYTNNQQQPAVTFTDTENPLLSGQIGIYANNADAAFSNLITTVNGVRVNHALKPESATQVTFQWTAVSKNAKASYALDTTNAFTGRQSQVIQFISGVGNAGVANGGLNHWGIAIKKGQQFDGSVYLKAESFSGPVTVALESADRKTTYSTAQIGQIDASWKKYPFSLTSAQSDANSRFVIYISNKGKLWIDQATLMNTDNVKFKGLPFREDIGTMMQKEGLNFLRYGGTMVNAPEYKWKNMKGTPSQRPPYKGHWYPYGSNGFGIEEFLKFCEAAGFEPAFAINVEDSAQDISQMIEYLTGDAASAEGKKRAQSGHPKPYKLRYIEIGNEEVIWGDKKEDYQHYADRVNILYNAIHAKNPEIHLICAAWWRPKSANMELVFNAINGKASYWDLHTDADEANAGARVDTNLQIMHDLFKKWDPNTTLKCTIFEENGGLHNLQRALGHATTLNAVRRHGDFVLTSCPANALQPYLQNDNDWDQGQIFFTPNQVWGMPPFYAQQMAAASHLPLRVDAQADSQLDVTATRSTDGKTIAIHVVNTGNANVQAGLTLKNFANRSSQIETVTLSGDPDAENTPLEPEKIKPVKRLITKAGDNIQYDFPAHSYTILSFKK